MIPLDELAPNYRRARDRWSTAPTLVAHYHTVAEAYEGTGQALIEAVKSFLECVCRTISTDYGAVPSSDASTTELLVASLDILGVRNSRGGNKFDRVLSAHNKLADALNDCRNQDGPIAHGKDGYLDALSSHHVRLYLLTGDTILSLVLGALDGTVPDLNHTREPYERFAHFNSAIDSAIGVEASVDLDDGMVALKFTTLSLRDGIPLRVEPSKLLYQLDRGAYIEILESIPRSLEIESAGVLPPAPSAIRGEFVAAGAEREANVLVNSYAGPLSALRSELEAELTSLGVELQGKVAKQLAPSLLRAFETTAGLDWTTRPSIRARIIISFKHLFRALGIRRPSPEPIAGRLVEWFAAKAPGGTVMDSEVSA